MNIQNFDKQIPIVVAALHNHIDIVRLLLPYRNHYDINFRDGYNYTVLDYIVDHNYMSLIEEVVMYDNIDLNIRNLDRLQALVHSSNNIIIINKVKAYVTSIQNK